MREFLTTKEYATLRNVDKILKLRKSSHAFIVLGADTKELSNELERYFTGDGLIEACGQEGVDVLTSLTRKSSDKTYLANIYRAKEIEGILDSLDSKKSFFALYGIKLIVITDKKSYETLQSEYARLFSLNDFAYLFTEPISAPQAQKVATKSGETRKTQNEIIDELFLRAKESHRGGDVNDALQNYKKALDLCDVNVGGHRKEDILHDMGLIYGSKETLSKTFKGGETSVQAQKVKLQNAANKIEYGDKSSTALLYRQQKTYIDASKQKRDDGQESQNESLSTKKERRAAIQLGAIGLLHQDKGDLTKALEYQKEALEMHKRIGYLRGTAEQLGNIGLIYINKGDLDRALVYQKEALESYKKMGHIEGAIGALGNIGVIYQSKGELDAAMSRHNEALEESGKIRYLYGMASALGNIGIIYRAKGDFEKALRYQKESLAIFKDLGDKQDVAKLLTNIAKTHEEEGDAKIAQTYLSEASQIEKEIGAKMATNIEITPLKEQKYINPVTIKYTLNGKERAWEAVKNLDSVAVLLYHVQKKAFLLVKQFRAPILLNEAKSVEEAYTYELCAGICDKGKSLEETAVEEIDEECGYKVSPEAIEKITAFHTCVGISGTYQSLFYAQIDESMRIHDGGGDHTEDIELVFLPVSEAADFALDTSKPKTPGVGLAFFWWLSLH